nr:leucine-rich repeat protein [Tanacetum cinerariifolium]
MKSPQAIIYSSSSSLISFLFYGLMIICLTSAPAPASYGGNETDYLALLSFKSMITQDPYQVLTSWNHSFHFCDWSGISCGKRHKRVTVLWLDSLGLEGSLSPQVGNLSFLRVLSLSNNIFQGTIPHELGRLSRLRGLYINANNFTGVIPTNLSHCSNLEELWLNLNELIGNIPKEMSLFSKLTSLVIYDNKLTGGIPPFLGNITSMEEFSAASNSLGGSIPDTLGLLKSLTGFYCGGCNLYGSIPHSIFNLSLLVNFSLPENHLTGSLPSQIGNQLPNLKILQLRNNELTGVLPPSISNCSKLGFLEMSNNSFSGKLAIDFSKLKDIYSVRLSYNNLHGRGESYDMRFIDSLKNGTRLERLELYNCHLKGVLPISIGNLSYQLGTLVLGENQLFGSLPSSIGNLVGLTALYLRHNRFKGKIPTTIGKLQKLQHLDLSMNQFSGPIPDAIGNLSLLNEVYLYSNKLEGNIPSSLGNCKELNGLAIRYNRLTGKIPKQLLQLPSLTNFLDLSYNNISGSIPSEIKDLKMLSILNLSSNNLSGTITSSLGECISLTVLDLSGNIFQGIIPSLLSSLRGLDVLDISQNNLSGKIPQFFDKWFSLEFLNLSYNDFEGELPVVGVFANANAFSVLGNDRLCGGLVSLELPKCKEEVSKKKRFPFFIFVIVIAPTLLIVLCCVYLFYKKKRNSQPSQSSQSERFLKVSYNELLRATNGFSRENLIVEGGLSSVYKGILDSDEDKFVAVKVLHLQNQGARKRFLAECEAWRNIRHRNLLKIITSCSSVDFHGNDFKALVYEFMSNGSVHDWLHSSENTLKLNLLQRINILKDVATALDYLHNRCQTTIVHGDLKPSNILLDDDMVAHIGDFGLARLLGTDLNQDSSTGVKGTIGYAPPEYGLGSEMTSSGDVYSFGILLLEVMTGKKPIDNMFNEGLSLHKFAYMALPDHIVDVIDDDAIVLQSTEADAMKMEECLVATIKIGVLCSVDSPPQRMKIEVIVIELQRIRDCLSRGSGLGSPSNWFFFVHSTIQGSGRRRTTPGESSRPAQPNYASTMLLDKVDAAAEVLKNLLYVVNAVRVNISAVKVILVLHFKSGTKLNAIFALPGHESTSPVSRKSSAIFALPGHEVRLPLTVSPMPYSHYPATKVRLLSAGGSWSSGLGSPSNRFFFVCSTIQDLGRRRTRPGESWNEFIFSLRMKDLISNETLLTLFIFFSSERNLLLVPYSVSAVPLIQWPPFLLASKIPIALDMAKDFKGKEDADLFRKINSDDYMRSSVTECCQTVKDILFGLLNDERDNM